MFSFESCFHLNRRAPFNETVGITQQSGAIYRAI